MKAYLTIKGDVMNRTFEQAIRVVAEELNLVGWIRSAGRDLVVSIAGDPCDVEEMVAWCWRGLPPLGKVREVFVDAMPPAMMPN